jgi:predicted ester cyclase
MRAAYVPVVNMKEVRMNGVEPKLVVERYLAEVLNGANPGSAPELIANEMFGEVVASFQTAFPDVQVRTHHVLAEGDLVAVHLTGRGTHLGLFQGCPPTGRKWTATCTAIYRVDAGRIADFRVTWDLLAIMEQLGCIERVASVSA